MSKGLDPDQARNSVGPDLGTNCLLRFSADDTGRQRVKQITVQVTSQENASYRTSRLKLDPFHASFFGCRVYSNKRPHAMDLAKIWRRVS